MSFNNTTQERKKIESILDTVNIITVASRNIVRSVTYCNTRGDSEDMAVILCAANTAVEAIQSSIDRITTGGGGGGGGDKKLTGTDNTVHSYMSDPDYSKDLTSDKFIFKHTGHNKPRKEKLTTESHNTRYITCTEFITKFNKFITTSSERFTSEDIMTLPRCENLRAILARDETIHQIHHTWNKSLTKEYVSEYHICLQWINARITTLANIKVLDNAALGLDEIESPTPGTKNHQDNNSEGFWECCVTCVTKIKYLSGQQGFVPESLDYVTNEDIKRNITTVHGCENLRDALTVNFDLHKQCHSLHNRQLTEEYISEHDNCIQWINDHMKSIYDATKSINTPSPSSPPSVADNMNKKIESFATATKIEQLFMDIDFINDKKEIHKKSLTDVTKRINTSSSSSSSSS